ncbi:RNA-binding domain-containing protein [Daedalea quercina L-15889]|uniref:RNA-binding domain-containing protein n=1 Tax=Daedalea quercina L-15889 TaxID=1314783 RepID=A0A165UAA6_9APHY|nr:RNA-binding domain-containing protein [Daedalea quercina L-15889]
MFIGGLNWDTTDEGLRKYFSQFGKVEACTIMRDAAGRSRCFAFLTFEDPASVNAVMVREHFLDGKIIDPKRAIPRQEHQRATKLFIGGLAGSVTSESMREYFSQFGKVVDATVMLDRETGRSKGFGFVSFENADVQPLLGFGNLEIDGKLIDVKLAQPRSQRENFSEGGGQGGYSRGGNFGGQGAQGAGFAGGSSGTGAGAGGNAPFDPQQLAQLYTRMMQQMGMNPMMAGSMNMMSGMGGGFGGGMGGGRMMPGMGMGMGAGMGPGMGMGRGGGGMASAGAMSPGGGMGPNVPRGPRNGPGGPGGPAGVGPQRAGQRGQHNYHPYAR